MDKQSGARVQRSTEVVTSRDGVDTKETELLLKVLMLSIEIDRKDCIIKELLMAVENGGREQI